MVEATEHHEIVLEVESELRGLHRAMDIMTICEDFRTRYLSRSMRKVEDDLRGIHTAMRVVNLEIERVQQVLDEITEEENESNSIR